MKFNKGDLIVVKTADEIILTCIVIDFFQGARYLYAYCLDSGNYRLIYEKEVQFVVEKEFDPLFPSDSHFWNVDYSFYEGKLYDFSWFPINEPTFQPDDEDDE